MSRLNAGPRVLFIACSALLRLPDARCYSPSGGCCSCCRWIFIVI